MNITEGYSIQKAGENDFSALAGLIVAENRRPQNQCLLSSLNDDASGLLQEMMKWAAIDEIVFMIAKRGGRIIGVMGSEYDQELGRGWLWGPFARVEDRTSLAKKLYEGLCMALPASIHHLDAFLNVENRWGYEFYISQGFQDHVRAHVYTARREEQSVGLDKSCVPLNPEQYASFCALHALIFPNAYFSAQRVLDQIDLDHQVFVQAVGSQAIGYVYVSVSSDPAEGEIEFLGVHPDARRNGLGRKLLKSGLNWLFVDRGVSRVTLTVNDDNVNARTLYEDAGFNLKYTGVGMKREL